MNEPSLHLMFSVSAAQTLRMALKQAGRNDEVIGLADCMSFGPIDNSDTQVRAHWVESELKEARWDSVLENSTIFWKQALADKRRKVLWTSQRCAMDYAGFLECIWRLGNTPCAVIDLTNSMFAGRDREGNLTKPQLVVSSGMLTHYHILDNGLPDQAQPLSQENRVRYQDVWKHLRVENAPLRIIEDNDLISAPITYFDELLRTCVTNEWRKPARVVGEALAKEMENALYQTGDLVLFARVRKLVELGVLESRGDMSEIQKYEVRLATVA